MLKLFEGYCPICKDKQNEMFINDMDLLECSECKSQILVDVPGVTAILLTEKGSGRKYKQISDKNSEVLFQQDLPHYPYSTFKVKVG